MALLAMSMPVTMPTGKFPTVTMPTTVLNVSKICIDNSAGFVLHWDMKDVLTDNKSPDSGKYPIDQTKCQMLDTIAGVGIGHPVLAT
jgi:hypothetical protein